MDNFTFSADKFGFRDAKSAIILFIGLLTSNIVYLGIYEQIESKDVIRIILFTFILLVPLLIMIFPAIFLPFGAFSNHLLRLLHALATPLSLIPYVRLKGKWYIEQDSEHIEILNYKQLISFMFRHIKCMILLPIGTHAILYKIFNNSQFHTSNTELVNENLLLLTFQIVLPLLLSTLYFSSVWVWEAAEIKILETNTNKDGTRLITNLWTASSSLDTIFSITLFGAAISWISQMELISLPELLDYSLIKLIINFLLATFFFMGPTFLIGMYFYGSDTHVEMVNSLRNRIYNQYNFSEEKTIRCPQCSGNKKHKTFKADGVTINLTRIIPMELE